MRRLSLAILLVCLHAAAASGQATADGARIRAVAIQYSHLSAGDERLNGWQAEYTRNRLVEPRSSPLWVLVGFDASLSQHYGSRRAGDGEIGDVSVRRTTALAGVRVFPVLPIPVYVRALAGVSHRAASRATTTPAFGAGFGVIFPVHDRVVIRPIQVDYLGFPGGGDVTSGVRVSAGVSVVW